MHGKTNIFRIIDIYKKGEWNRSTFEYHEDQYVQAILKGTITSKSVRTDGRSDNFSGKITPRSHL